ncbi:hypothetical protein, partial [Enterobacter asburiae]
AAGLRPLLITRIGLLREGVSPAPTKKTPSQSSLTKTNISPYFMSTATKNNNIIKKYHTTKKKKKKINYSYNLK